MHAMGRDDGGGSGAKGFGEFSGGVRGENFVDGDWRLRRQCPSREQSQSRVAVSRAGLCR